MSGRDSAFDQIRLALSQANFAEFTKHASEAIKLMLGKDSNPFNWELNQIKLSANSKIFCNMVTLLKNKLKKYIPNPSEIEWQLNSFISHAQNKFPTKSTTSNYDKQNISNLQFNKQPQKPPPKNYDQYPKQDDLSHFQQSPKQVYSKPVQPSNFQLNFKIFKLKNHRLTIKNSIILLSKKMKIYNFNLIQIKQLLN
jgi:hypothetical protein